jgi:hypothetical protein
VPSDVLHLGLLAIGWMVAFLLGKELQNGFYQWRRRTAERPVRHDDD